VKVKTITANPLHPNGSGPRKNRDKATVPGPSLASAEPLIIAHRGARDQAPDNTRSAFERALEHPVDGIELDVQMSADGVPVLYHDATLFRILHRRRRLSTLTYAELATYDWGAWFDPAFAGEPLLTLDQALALLARRTRLLIEIKSQPIEQRSGRVSVLAQKVAALLAHPLYRSCQANIHILSFDPHVLDVIQRIAPQWRFILNLSEKEPTRIMAAPPEFTGRLWAVDVKFSHLSAELVQWARHHHLRVFTYTCNTRQQVHKAMNLAVDGMLTDRPGWLTAYLGRSMD
jgi:glycerophosphoryl diester phosphodiesterase